MPTVRDATLDVARALGLTTVYANPGSTEANLLAGLPDDFRFVLALHEGSVVGMATGAALATGEPALAVVHTTAGLGNAVGALATARVNRAPLVVLAGQQDRRHLALEPFLAGHLLGLAGDYPVWTDQPTRPQDVPGSLARAYHEAAHGPGPALLIVPMDDWLAPADDSGGPTAPLTVRRTEGVAPVQLDDLATMVTASVAPVIVAGAGSGDQRCWDALVALAERLRCPVWQEPFGARAGFPQDHPLFAGHLPAVRSGVRGCLAGHDLVLAVGAPVFRQYPYAPGRLVEPGTRVAIVTADPAEAFRGPVDLAVLGPVAAICQALGGRVPARSEASAPAAMVRPTPPEPPAPGVPLANAHVLAALGERMSPDTIIVEESPSGKGALFDYVPIRWPGGYHTAAMGGLGFGLPAAVGARLGRPDRPVVALIGDGSSYYAIQALWTAAHYRIGVLFLVLTNGGYAIMDRVAHAAGGKPPWPALNDLSVTEVSRGFGCPAERVDDHDGLVAALDRVVPGLVDRAEPYLLEVVVDAEEGNGG